MNDSSHSDHPDSPDPQDIGELKPFLKRFEQELLSRKADRTGSAGGQSAAMTPSELDEFVRQAPEKHQAALHAILVDRRAALRNGSGSKTSDETIAPGSGQDTAVTDPNATIDPTSASNDPNATIDPTPADGDDPDATIDPTATINSGPDATIDPTPAGDDPDATIDPTATINSGPDATIDPTPAPTRDFEDDPDATIDPTATINSGPDATIDPTSPDSSSGNEDTFASSSAMDSGLQATMDSSAGGDEPVPRTVEIPEVTGYEMLGELGRGGMGVVYKARQKGLNRIVALKMVLAGGHASEDQLARFHAEAQAVAELQHPNIVQVYDVGEHNGLPFFSLEFVDGKPLDEEIDGKPIMPERAADLVEQTARAMHFAHEHGILHRDLKPQNILLTVDGIPKVTDFGLVKRIEGDDEASQTRTGTIMGTPSYMPPEQGRGEKELGPTADVYALGAVLYCLITGRPPFAAPTAFETLMQALNEEPVPPSRLQPKTPPDLETICLKCLQKDPTKRYATADDLAEDLRRYQVGEPILARPVGAVERAWRWCRRNPRVAIPASIAAVLALVVLIGAPIATAIVWQQKNEAVEAQALAKKNAKAANAARAVAKANERVAQENETKALQAQQTAEENEAKAVEAQQLAARQNRLALDTLKRLVQEVQGELKNKPRMQALRESLLFVAMEGLDEVSAIGGSATSKDVAMAGALRRMGDIYAEMGNSEKALEQYQQCHEIVAALAADDRLPAKHHNLSFSLMNLGRVAKQAGQTKLAMQYFQDALDVRREWVIAEPNNRYIPQNVAETLGWIGGTALSLGNLELAEEAYNESRALREEWLEWDPASRTAQQQLAGSDDAMAQLMLQKGDVEEAARYTDEAIQSFETLIATYPENRSDQWNLAIFRARMGTVKIFEEEFDVAVDYYRQALPVVETFAEEDPQNALLRDHLAQYYYGLGTALEALDDPEAAEAFQQSLALRRELYEEDASNIASRGQLALTLARCGLHAEAAQHTDEFLAGDCDVQDMFTAACVYALCGDSVHNDGSLEEVQQQDRSEQYLAKAVDTLQLALENGYQRTATLPIEPDLAPLRDHPEFRRLLANTPEASSTDDSGAVSKQQVVDTPASS